METEEEQSEQVIPVEDDEGNFKLLIAEKILYIKAEVEDDLDSDAIFYYEDGKKYKGVHTEKAVAQFNEWIKSEENKS
ncbi:hypothetical protein ACP8HI_13660 [Paenibacillus sp. FA6]|uniref:hypothetical protein n=1 Tax=Paenibacillus sp. FA6 TaxID=3413029 RepID=UPI003F65B037